ncbi:MAG: PA0069 family radical SAM protein [Maricaulaceae bacterium]|nr:PA0069 family radical SAM protein [Maricaulaceae bacterium]
MTKSGKPVITPGPNPLPPPLRPPGRGAVSNATGRFEPVKYEPFDDGWTAEDPAPKQLRTVLVKDASRTIISRNDSPDISFSQSINPFRGCEHGCIYCYARPSHAYWGYSPGLDFESVIFVKPEAPALLEKTLLNPRYRPVPVVIGANTDPYQPIERKLQTTRELLKVLSRFNHPASFITKSALCLRDLDILAPMAAKGLVRAAVSVTTLDRRLARDMEPRAATPQKRLDAIRGLNAAGVPVTVMAAPMIPALNDRELETILETAKEAGASGAGYVLLRLPYEIKDLFKEWLAAARPDAAAHVMSLIRQCRGGKDYDATWGKRGRGDGPYAAMLARRFRKAVERLGLNRPGPGLRTDLFERPLSTAGQPSLF